MEWPFVSRREYQRALAERNDADRCFGLAQAKLSKMEIERDQIRMILNNADVAVMSNSGGGWIMSLPKRVAQLVKYRDTLAEALAVVQER